MSAPKVRDVTIIMDDQVWRYARRHKSSIHKPWSQTSINIHHFLLCTYSLHPISLKMSFVSLFFFFTQHLSLALLYVRLGAVWSEALVFMSVTLAPGLAGSIWLMLTSTYSNNLQGNKYFISLRALKHYTFNYALLSASTVSSRVRLKGSRGVVTTHTVNEQKK